MLTALVTLNSSITTKRAKAFTVHTVTSTADSGSGSLRAAVVASVPGDMITFNLALPATISLTSGEIDIVSSINVTGTGIVARLTASARSLISNRIAESAPVSTPDS
jgi:hypothetical protein